MVLFSQTLAPLLHIRFQGGVFYASLPDVFVGNLPRENLDGCSHARPPD
jgi:hypothetical protein